MPPSAGLPRFDHRADVTGMGLVALALILGRPLAADEFPHAIPALLNEARERSPLGEEQPLSPPLRNWLVARAAARRPPRVRVGARSDGGARGGRRRRFDVRRRAGGARDVPVALHAVAARGAGAPHSPSQPMSSMASRHAALDAPAPPRSQSPPPGPPPGVRPPRQAVAAHPGAERPRRPRRAITSRARRRSSFERPRRPRGSSAPERRVPHRRSLRELPTPFELIPVSSEACGRLRPQRSSRAAKVCRPCHRTAAQPMHDDRRSTRPTFEDLDSVLPPLETENVAAVEHADVVEPPAAVSAPPAPPRGAARQPRRRLVGAVAVIAWRRVRTGSPVRPTPRRLELGTLVVQSNPAGVAGVRRRRRRAA